MRSPLLEAGLNKADIRALSKALGLPTWSKPSLACLSSRIPYGTPVTAEALAQIDAAENFLHDLGFPQVRVRHYAEQKLARIEVEPELLPRLVAPGVARAGGGAAEGARLSPCDDRPGRLPLRQHERGVDAGLGVGGWGLVVCPMNEPPPPTRRGGNAMVADGQDRQAQLEAERRAVYAEIKSYPRPIPACDVQFNTLLADRARLDAEAGPPGRRPARQGRGVNGPGFVVSCVERGV